MKMTTMMSRARQLTHSRNIRRSNSFDTCRLANFNGDTGTYVI